MQLFIIVLFFFLSHVAMVAGVDGCNSGKDKDNRPQEDCTAAGFSDIPAGLEPTTKVLLFPSNQFTSLSWSSFQVFTQIHEIDLTGNKVPVVTPTGTAVLPSLSVLRLGSNRLKSLSDGSFSACPALTELYLENNAIGSLSNHTFSGLSKLEILDISSNNIRVLPLLLLHPLLAIETLVMEKNKIRVLPDDWFVQKEEVPYLYLSENPWACSCSLGYLRRYLDDYELNVYVRDGRIVKGDVESVVCDSPQSHKGTAVINLEESELCSLPTESGPTGDFDQPMATDDPYMTLNPTTTPPAPLGHTTAIINVGTHTNPAPIAFATTTPTNTPAHTTFVIPTPTNTPVHTTFATTTTPTNTPVHTTFVTPTPTNTPVHTTFATTTTPTNTPVHTTFATTTTPAHTTFTTTTTTTTTHPTLRLTTESPDNTTIIASTKPAETTKAAPTTATSTTPKLEIVTTTTATEVTTMLTTVSTPSWVINNVGSDQHRRQFAGAAAGGFCLWLFVGGVLLCIAAAACALVTLARLIIWYRRVYKPLSAMLARRGRGGGEGVKLLKYSGREEQVAIGGGGVRALYRSVLFISREEGEAEETGGGGRDVTTFKPTGGGGATTEEEKEGGREEKAVYKKTIYRLVSKQEELEGWRDVMEECRVSAEDGGRRGGSVDGGRVSRKRYSVILREEREEAEGGREEQDWVVGGWEVKKGGGEEPSSNWGEWLGHFLPSTPWGVTTPPEGEAAQ